MYKRQDELEAAVQIFHVRDGRIRGQRGWVVERAGDQASSEPLEEGQPDPALPALVQNFLIQFYSDAVEREKQEAREDAALAADVKRRGVDQESHMKSRRVQVIPRQILVQALPDEPDQVVALLEELRGAQVDLRVPQRGDKKQLMATVEKNAKEQLRQHKLKRVGDLTARSAALQDIQEALGMEQAPLRIECTDISHIQGTDVVASLVVFEDGLPKKSDYRRYRIKEAAGDGRSDDVGSIAEVTRRRFKRYKEDKLAQPDEEVEESSFAEEKVAEESAEAGRRFAYPPQLFIVDGGAPQVAAAQEVFDLSLIHI